MGKRGFSGTVRSCDDDDTWRFFHIQYPSSDAVCIGIDIGNGRCTEIFCFYKRQRQPVTVGVAWRMFLGGPGRNRTTDTRIFNPRKMAFIAVD